MRFVELVEGTRGLLHHSSFSTRKKAKIELLLSDKTIWMLEVLVPVPYEDVKWRWECITTFNPTHLIRSNLHVTKKIGNVQLLGELPAHNLGTSRELHVDKVSRRHREKWAEMGNNGDFLDDFNFFEEPRKFVRWLKDRIEEIEEWYAKHFHPDGTRK